MSEEFDDERALEIPDEELEGIAGGKLRRDPIPSPTVHHGVSHLEDDSLGGEGPNTKYKDLLSLIDRVDVDITTYYEK